VVLTKVSSVKAKKSSVKGGIKKKVAAPKKAKGEKAAKHPPFSKMITAALKTLAKENEGG